MSGQSFHFGTQAQVGMVGMQRIVAYLTSRGMTVVDVEADKDWRRRDVDVIVNGRTMEIKTDTHTSGNVYLELSCDGKPGCVFKSRAEVWCYWLPVLDILLFMKLPDLQLWLLEHAHEYARKTIQSHRGKNSAWKAVGIAVPIAVLLDADVAVKVGSPVATVRYDTEDTLTPQKGTDNEYTIPVATPTSTDATIHPAPSGAEVDTAHEHGDGGDSLPRSRKPRQRKRSVALEKSA